MSRSFVRVSMLLITLVSACVPVNTPPTPTPAVTAQPPTTSVANVQSVEIQTLESDPLRVNAVVRGQLPDAGCTTISSVDQVREDNAFQVTLMTTTDPLALCAQALTPFEQVIPLDVSDLSPGSYSVSVNGIEQSFDLPAPVQDLAEFEETLVEALNARNYDVLEPLMSDPFIIGYWLSEGTSNTPDQAVEQFRRSLLNSSTPVTADPNKDLTALLGMDPITILGPEVIEAKPLFTSGWGPEGNDEAILFIAERADGSLYWHGLLFAGDGFEQPAPTQPAAPSPTPVATLTPGGQPTSVTGKIPTITIEEVVRDSKVTIRAHDYPANTDFEVRMGQIGTQGINGIWVGTINSAQGGTFLATFDIPSQLYGQEKIAIRLESRTGGYYSYNWFNNE